MLLKKSTNPVRTFLIELNIERERNKTKSDLCNTKSRTVTSGLLTHCLTISTGAIPPGRRSNLIPSKV